jgi:hypothetical protein
MSEYFEGDVLRKCPDWDEKYRHSLPKSDNFRFLFALQRNVILFTGIPSHYLFQSSSMTIISMQ